jgi:hypothetical protein
MPVWRRGIVTKPFLLSDPSLSIGGPWHHASTTCSITLPDWNENSSFVDYGDADGYRRRLLPLRKELQGKRPSSDQ